MTAQICALHNVPIGTGPCRFHVHSNVVQFPKKPVWIQRMQEGKLPNKDLTGKGPDAA